MQKPEPTRRQKERYLKASRFVYKVEFTLDFTHPVTIQQGREWARKVLDALNLEAKGLETPVELDEVSLKCSELRRLLRVKLEGPE
jgi:hypothetical protein